MAITITNSPQSYNPAYNDMIITVTSTNVAQPSFKFVADIYIGSDVIRVYANKDILYNSGVFNFGRIIENYVSSNISKSTYGFQQNTGSYISWYVKFGEQYGTSLTIYPSLTTSSTYYSWNSIFDFVAFQSYTQTPYVLQSAAVKQLLTNKPATTYIRDSEDAWLYSAVASSGVIYDARVRTYNSSGSLIQTVKVNNPYQAISSPNDRFVRFGCGTSNLNSIASSGITTGAQPIITASVYSYDITFEMFNGTLVSTPQTFTIDQRCSQHTSYRLHFLNELGGFDSFTFFRANKRTEMISRTNYSKNVNRSTSNSAYGYSLTDRSTTNLDIRIKDNIKVQSDWISESECVWLEELITSPEVYIDDATSGLIAINILNSSFEFKQSLTDKLFNMEIEFEYSYERTRQRR